MEVPRSLRVLRQPALRLFFAGQAVSLLGSWMQPVAQQWLVWRLTGSTRMLGLLTFCTQLPALLLGAWAGSVVDRVPRKTVVLVALGVAALQAAMLAVLALTGWVEPAHVLLLGVMLGLTYPFEIPARQVMLAELAGSDTQHVVAFNSTLVTVMRIIGPSVGGLVTAWWGEGWCFAFNGVSFVGVLFAVAALPSPKTAPREAAPVVPIGEAVRWVWGEPTVRTLFGQLVVLSVFGQAWGTLMPAWVATVLEGGPDVLGHLLSFAGVGALLAAGILLLREEGQLLRIAFGGLTMAGGILGLAFATSVVGAAAALFFLGLGQLTQSSGILSELVQRAPPPLRGRVLGLFTAGFVGLVPVGALGAGWVAAELDAPRALMLLGVVLLGSSLWTLARLSARRR